MNCLDAPEIPTIQAFDVATFEDFEYSTNNAGIEDVQICGFHPMATAPLSVEEQEALWETFTGVYTSVFLLAICTVIGFHVGLLLKELWKSGKKTFLKKIFLRAGQAEKSPAMGDILAFTPHYVWFTNGDKQAFAGLTQDDFVDFERFAHFIYAQSHET
ncbi:unnamed protein product [Mesocestoides corti]|uniref:Innexin n=1 Tax=Mesocestoides corti TaxID=53468 RepID=A0A0R3ULM5_MESCO|nr:unnamed protein product [Mesocestoides corti]